MLLPRIDDREARKIFRSTFSMILVLSMMFSVLALVSFMRNESYIGHFIIASTILQFFSFILYKLQDGIVDIIRFKSEIR